MPCFQLLAVFKYETFLWNFTSSIRMLRSWITKFFSVSFFSLCSSIFSIFAVSGCGFSIFLLSDVVNKLQNEAFSIFNRKQLTGAPTESYTGHQAPVWTDTYWNLIVLTETFWERDRIECNSAFPIKVPSGHPSETLSMEQKLSYWNL